MATATPARGCTRSRLPRATICSGRRPKEPPPHSTLRMVSELSRAEAEPAAQREPAGLAERGDQVAVRLAAGGRELRDRLRIAVEQQRGAIGAALAGGEVARDVERER